MTYLGSRLPVYSLIFDTIGSLEFFKEDCHLAAVGSSPIVQQEGLSGHVEKLWLMSGCGEMVEWKVRMPMRVVAFKHPIQSKK